LNVSQHLTMDAGYLRKRGIVHIPAELFGNSTHAFGRFRNAHLLSSVRCPFLEGVPILNSDTPPFIIRSWNEQVTEYHQLGNVYRAILDISIGFEKRSLSLSLERGVCAGMPKVESSRHCTSTSTKSILVCHIPR